uniref:Uncharacterized protein n=1 Tax=Macaca fascicularis TaxID=9541 RepID=A0A7N9IGP7_MACFA
MMLSPDQAADSDHPSSAHSDPESLGGTDTKVLGSVSDLEPVEEAEGDGKGGSRAALYPHPQQLSREGEAPPPARHRQVPLGPRHPRAHPRGSLQLGLRRAPQIAAHAAPGQEALQDRDPAPGHLLHLLSQPCPGRVGRGAPQGPPVPVSAKRDGSGWPPLGWRRLRWSSETATSRDSGRGRSSLPVLSGQQGNKRRFPMQAGGVVWRARGLAGGIFQARRTSWRHSR